MTYNADSVQVLEGLEAVRKRPGMYIGSTGSRGLHHLAFEILDNSIDEHLAGYCDTIKISLNKDGSVTISDNGRGIPVDRHKKGISAARIIFTTLHAGGKFDNTSYKVSGGLHGVGAAVVNALSKYMKIVIHKDSHIYQDEYKDGGKPITKLKDGLIPPVGTTDQTGTEITFVPDDTIFETVQFDPKIFKKKLTEIAFLNKGLKIIFQTPDEEIIFHEKEGLMGFIKYINQDRETIHDPIYIAGKKNNMQLELAIQYTNEPTENILSFCNNINTIEGGTHVSGFKSSLTRIINQYARELNVLKDKDENFDGRDVRNGITAILSLKHPNPQYEGQTKTKLSNSDARSVVDEILSIEGQKFFDRNIEILKSILEKAQQSFKLRKAEEKVRNNFLSKSFPTNSKLAACQSRDNTKTELFIVEGDSAGGTAKQARDRKFQAILPLRGKILNVEKNNVSKILSNLEITTLISTLGTGFGEGLKDDFDINRLKYSKIIILTDADVDGAHIRTLLLTFFFRYMPELIFEGKIYLGMPPLYRVRMGNKDHYFYSDKELEGFKKKNKNKNFTIQRYKGLGEMNPDQLWETTLNPKTRKLKQVSIDSAIAADEITLTLMGNQTAKRKKLLQEKAELANLDI